MLIDCGWTYVRRKLGGVCGGSQYDLPYETSYPALRTPYLRRKPNTPNRRSPRQLEVRSLAVRLSKAWKDELDEDQRFAWYDWSYYQGWVDKCDRTRVSWPLPEGGGQEMDGFHWFFGVNMRMMLFEGLMDKEAIGYSLPSTLPGASIEFVDNDTIEVTFTTTLDSYLAIYVWWGGPMRPGQDKRYHEMTERWMASTPSNWQRVGAIPRSATSPYQLTLPRTVYPGQKAVFLLGVYDVGIPPMNFDKVAVVNE